MSIAPFDISVRVSQYRPCGGCPQPSQAGTKSVPLGLIKISLFISPPPLHTTNGHHAVASARAALSAHIHADHIRSHNVHIHTDLQPVRLDRFCYELLNLDAVREPIELIVDGYLVTCVGHFLFAPVFCCGFRN